MSALRDVPNKSRENRRPVVSNTRNTQFHGKLLSVSAEGGHFRPLAQHRGFSGGQVTVESAAMALSQGGRNDQLDEFHSQCGGALVPEHLFRRRIPLKNPSFVINGYDRIQRGLKYRALARLAFTLRGLGDLAGGYVTNNDEVTFMARLNDEANCNFGVKRDTTQR